MDQTTREDIRDLVRRELGDPEEDADLYRERSPLTHASKIRSPLLVLQGENDPQVPRSEAEQLMKALRDGGAVHEYHVYPDEGHGFRLTENRIDAVRRTLDWFERYLRKS
jgi:dipeptidyl aminopeptidase/acylaminoacyl peptidase